MTASKDTIFRAMTDDGAFRIVTLNATQTVTGVLAAQAVQGSTARHLANLATGAVMLRETMSPGLRVQGILKLRDSNGYLLGDSHPSGSTRGLAGGKIPAAGFEMEGALLQVVRTLHDGRVQQGVVSVPDGTDVSSGLMAYMQESEQITTMIVVNTLFDGEQVAVSGGYLIQLLPGAPRGPVTIMTERLEDFKNIDPLLSAPEFTARALAEELLWGFPFTELEHGHFEYGCWCSRTSMLSALASVQRGEIQAMVDDGQVLEISCDYCKHEYRVTPAELQGLLESN